MKLLFILLFSVLAIYLIWELSTRKYINIYQLYILFGPKGVGKSTLLQKLAHYYIKRGFNVYCNIGDCSAPGVIQIPIEDVPELAEAGHRLLHYKDPTIADKLKKRYEEYPPKDNDGNPIKVPAYIKQHSVIFHDEINLTYDNRNFKNFSKDSQRFFRLQRHYKLVYIGISQSYDVDLKLRTLADKIIILDKFARIFVTSKSYMKKPMILRATAENSRECSKEVDDFIPLGFFYDLFSPFRCFLPYWVKKHDSYK